VARWIADDEEVKRLDHLLERLLVGIALEFAYNPSNREHQRAGARNEQRRPPPKPNFDSIVLKRPISINCAPAVREYLHGAKARAPTVQTLVRGHWKMQAHGSSNE